MNATSQERVRVLLVEDDLEALQSLLRAVKAHEKSYEVQTAATPEAAREVLSGSEPFHVVVLDLSLNAKEGVESGFRVLAEVQRRDPTTRVIVVTGHTELEHGVRALNLGAASFVGKPPNLEHLMALVRDAASQALIRREHARVVEREHRALERLVVGESHKAQELRENILAASRTLQPVLIRGETGTGKNLCAEAIHNLSVRAHAKFVRYQTSFGSSDLTNSDLFGHVKGAFTGAEADRVGLIQLASGGTLFLDEVQALPLETQIALLGVLQDQRVRPLGGNTEQRAEFRLISATNADVESQLREGSLRADFYHRISGIEIEIPPLRERSEDVPLLAEMACQQFQHRYASPVLVLSEEVLRLLKAHEWPGNVRELQAVMESAAWAAVGAGRDSIQAADIRFKQTQRAEVEVEGLGRIAGNTLEEKISLVTYHIVQEAVKAAGGNVTRAAQQLGTSRWTIQRVLGERRPGR